ncbi:unnamed protein product [Musa acuminata subsp. burmannicoides]
MRPDMEEMKRRMAGIGFRRSISFSAVPHPFSQPCHRSARGAAELSFRARSVSLPARLHPLADHLRPELCALRSWCPSPSPASLSDGLVRVQLLLAALPDLLSLPQAQDPLRRRRRYSRLADRLLDDLLRLADAHASFRSAALDLKHRLSATRAALRRRNDGLRLSSCLRSQRRAEKELFKLASLIRVVGRSPPLFTGSADEEEAELAKVMKEVITVTAATSAAVFNGVAALSASTTMATPALPPTCTWVAAVMRWRERARLKLLKKGGGTEKSKEVEVDEEEEEEEMGALERLVELEDCMAEMEKGSELVFRTLVNTRVSLLNILTPGF